MNGHLRRERALDRLERVDLDLLVVGAGIVGSRIAYEAAHHGLRVGLVDAGDFGGGTSSASSKLVHGGLRYLATGDLRLVRHLQAERRVLMSLVAPHLVRPLPLLLAVERSRAGDTSKLMAALAVYGALAGSRHDVPGLVGPTRARALVPPLDTSAVALAGVVPEAQTHDARLTLATVRGAGSLGAITLNYVRLDAFEHKRGSVFGAVLRDLGSGRALTVRCRAAVNATGPWVDRVRRLEDDRAQPITRLSKGIHAVLPLERPWHAGIALFDNSRTAIAVPWQGMLLAGTTDDEFDGDPGAVAAGPGEIGEVLAPLARLTGDHSFDPGRVVHSFAGIRVLRHDGRRTTARASRRHVVETGTAGVVSVAGGKLTTHRLIALDVLRRLPPEVRPHRVRASSTPLPGAGIPRSECAPDSETAVHLRGLYGSEATRVLAYAEAEPGLLDRIHDAGPDILAQACFARDEEYALTVDDVATRRTTLAVRGLADEAVRQQIAAVLPPSRAPRLDLDDEQPREDVREEVDRMQDERERERIRLLDPVRLEPDERRGLEHADRAR